MRQCIIIKRRGQNRKSSQTFHLGGYEKGGYRRSYDGIDTAKPVFNKRTAKTAGFNRERRGIRARKA